MIGVAQSQGTSLGALHATTRSPSGFFFQSQSHADSALNRAGAHTAAQLYAMQQRNKRNAVLKQARVEYQRQQAQKDATAAMAMLYRSSSVTSMPASNYSSVGGGYSSSGNLGFDYYDTRRRVTDDTRIHNERDLVDATLRARNKGADAVGRLPAAFTSGGYGPQPNFGYMTNGSAQAPPIVNTSYPLPSERDVRYANETFTDPRHYSPLPVVDDLRQQRSYIEPAVASATPTHAEPYRAVVQVGTHAVGVESAQPMEQNTVNADPAYVSVTDVHKILNKRKAVSERNFHDLIKLFDTAIRIGASMGQSWITLQVPTSHPDVYYEDADEVFERVKAHFIKQGFRVKTLSTIQRIIKVAA